jgi:hypothetical protein
MNRRWAKNYRLLAGARMQPNRAVWWTWLDQGRVAPGAAVIRIGSVGRLAPFGPCRFVWNRKGERTCQDRIATSQASKLDYSRDTSWTTWSRLGASWSSTIGVHVRNRTRIRRPWYAYAWGWGDVSGSTKISREQTWLVAYLLVISWRVSYLS